MRVRYENDILHKRIRDQWVFIGLLSLLVGFMGFGWLQATRELPPIDILPDLSQGGTVVPGEFSKPFVYSFAYLTWQQINRWSGDGQADYADNLFKLSPYLTKRCRTVLEADKDSRARDGELVRRTRWIQQMLGRGYEDWRVHRAAPGLWEVTLDVELEEQFGAMPVKHGYYRYRLPIVYHDVDRLLNPMSLAIDCRERPVPAEIEEVTP